MVGKQSALQLFKSKAPTCDRKISEIIDIETQLEKFNNEKLNLLKTRKIYDTSMISRSNIIQTIAEQKVSCIFENEQISLPLIVKTDWEKN